MSKPQQPPRPTPPASATPQEPLVKISGQRLVALCALLQQRNRARYIAESVAVHSNTNRS